MTQLAGKDVTPQEVATETLRLGDELERLGKDLTQHIAKGDIDLTALDAKLDKLSDAFRDEVRRLMDELRKHVPVWVTAVITLMGTMLGIATGIAYFASSQLVVYQTALAK